MKTEGIWTIYFIKYGSQESVWFLNILNVADIIQEGLFFPRKHKLEAQSSNFPRHWSRHQNFMTKIILWGKI